MDAYIVRFSKTKQLLGIFVSPSEDRLWWYVDEATDVRDCDFLKLPAGGAYVVDRDTPTVPTIADATADAKEPDWLGGCVPSERWDEIFRTAECDQDWRPISAAKGDPNQ